jgi:endonuclease YncB( thermonuclease family)
MHPVSKAHCIKSYAGRIFSLFTFAFSLSVLSASTASFTGPVVSVLDGDTIEVLHSNKAERIRLNGIDCPEKGQAYGNNAKHAASDLAFGKEVTLQTHGKDKYGRTLAVCSYPMAPTSITRWSKTADAGGIGSMRREIPCSKG